MRLFKSNWSEWIDLSTGSVDEIKYLLQARRHKNGRVQFGVSKSSAVWGCDVPSIEQLKSISPKTEL